MKCKAKAEAEKQPNEGDGQAEALSENRASEEHARGSDSNKSISWKQLIQPARSGTSPNSQGLEGEPR